MRIDRLELNQRVASANLTVIQMSLRILLSLGLLFNVASFSKTNSAEASARTSLEDRTISQSGQNASTVVVTSVENSIYPNQSAPLIATVSVNGLSPAPTGSVNFMLGANALATATLTPIDPSDSTAVITVNGSQLALGSNNISAIYSGDANYSGSSSTITLTLLSPQVSVGPVQVGTPSTVQTLTYTFSASITLSAINILTAGASGLDYADGGSSTCAVGVAYTPGQNCVITVVLTPSAPGQRSGGVTLFAQGNTPLMTWYLSGVGQSSAVTIDPGTQSTIATFPSDILFGSAIDAAGNFYVVDNASSQVLELAAGSFAQSTLVPTGPLSNPTAVALDGAGNLYISDSGNNRVVIVPNENGTLNSGDMSPANITGLGSPRGIAVDAGGNLYVADGPNGSVVELPSGGGALVPIATGLTNPRGIAVDASGNVYVTSDSAVTEYPSVGGTPIPIGTGYNTPYSVAVDSSGTVYVADTGNVQIVEIIAGNATQINFPMTGLSTPRGIALDASANVYITDGANVYKVNRSQTPPLNFGITYVGSTSSPQTLTVSNVGNQQLNIPTIAIAPNFIQGISSGTDCAAGTPLPSGGQCLLAMEFSPALSGSLFGTITLSDNALNATSMQSAQLSGAASQVGQTVTFGTLANVIYGNAPLAVNATASSGLPVTLSVVSGPAVVSGNMVTVNGAGSITLEADQAGSIQFSPAQPVQQSFIAGKAVLTVTAQSASMTYAAAVPALTSSIVGLVNGDNLGAVSGTASLTTTATSASPAGSYPIIATQGTLAALNYAFTFVNASLAINKATLTVTAQSASMIYGASVPAFTSSIVGFVNGDNLSAVSGTASLTTTATSASPVGQYPITAMQGTLAAMNYGFTFVNASLTINKAALAVSANNLPTTYGTIPTLTYTFTGFVNGDNSSAVSGLPSLSTTAKVTSPPGTYAITISSGSLAAVNYTFTSFASATLTVSKAVLTATASNLSTTYGWAIPAPAYTIAGFMNSDTRASVTSGNPIVTTTAIKGVAVGTYPITISLGTLSVKSTNYTLNLVNGLLTVGKAVLEVIGVGAKVSYFAAIPNLQYNLIGFVNGDKSSVISGAAVVSTTAVQGSGVGTYPIIPAQGTLASANYTFTFINGTLTVFPVGLTVRVTSASMTYGGPVPALAYYITGFPSGANQSVVSGKPQLTTTAAPSYSAGSYAIVASLGTLTATPNYTFSFLNGILTIKKATLIVQANNIIAPINQPVPTLTYTMTGFVNSDTQGSAVAGTPNLTTTATGSQVGDFPISTSTGTLSASNYSFTFVNGILFIVTNSPSNYYSQAFQHVVVIFQENRTPDNLFHGFPNADIAGSGVNSTGQTIPLTPIALANNYDLSHAHNAFVEMYDSGKMDGANKITISCNIGAVNCPPANPQFMYVNPSDVQPYFQLGEQYTFGDRMFQTNQGPSFPAHQFIISGTSAPTATSNLFAAENPSPNGGTGCAAPATATVALINPFGVESQYVYPCFEHPTLMDSLDAQTISWRYYTPAVNSGDAIWIGPLAIHHLYFGGDWANVIVPQTKVLTDIANGQLAQVSWVIPNGLDSDHPGGNNGTGPAWVASVVNAIGNSPYWSNTAIIITWDDWGGWYDHVAPPIYNSYEYGFRVPLIIVSPYSKQGYVSHVPHDFGSIVKFIDEVFDLPGLGYADARADDFSDCFDLTQAPITFQTIPASPNKDFFLNTKRPVTPPDDDGDEE